MTTIQKKGYWEKPENYTKVLLYVTIAVLGFWFLDEVLPVVNRVLDYALETTFKTIALVTVLAIVTWVVTSTRLHQAAWVAYDILMKKLTGIFVTMDPIVVKERFALKIAKDAEELAQAVGQLRGKQKELKRDIDVNQKQIDDTQAEAVSLEKKIAAGANHLKGEFVLRSHRIASTEQTLKTLMNLYEMISAHLAMAEKFHERAKIEVGMLRESVRNDRIRRNATESSYKVMGVMKGFIAMSESRELFNMAIEEDNKQHFERLGEIEQFLRDSKDIIVSGDIANEAAEASALAKVKEWEERSHKLLNGPSVSATKQIDQRIKTATQNSDYVSMFDKL